MNEFFDFFVKLFTTPISELSVYQIAIAAAICVAAFFTLKWLFKFLLAGLKWFGKLFKLMFSAKARCKKTVCPHCGKTLDKCSCVENKKRGYLSRIVHHNKEMRERKKTNKN